MANQNHAYFDHHQQATSKDPREPLAICGDLPLEKVYGWQTVEKYPDELRDRCSGRAPRARIGRGFKIDLHSTCGGSTASASPTGRWTSAG
ncbi:MAG: hypothetical protein ABW223_03800 [Rariglobus sp.]